jgi:hypothetical protein
MVVSDQFVAKLWRLGKILVDGYVIGFALVLMISIFTQPDEISQAVDNALFWPLWLVLLLYCCFA